MGRRSPAALVALVMLLLASCGPHGAAAIRGRLPLQASTPSATAPAAAKPAVVSRSGVNALFNDLEGPPAPATGQQQQQVATSQQQQQPTQQGQQPTIGKRAARQPSDASQADPSPKQQQQQQAVASPDRRATASKGGAPARVAASAALGTDGTADAGATGVTNTSIASNVTSSNNSNATSNATSSGTSNMTSNATSSASSSGNSSTSGNAAGSASGSSASGSAASGGSAGNAAAPGQQPVVLAAAANAAVPPPPVVQRMPESCQGITVTTAFIPWADPKTRALVLNGTASVANGSPYVAALQRVGVRLCSRALLLGHLRVEAMCPSYDVMKGTTLVCTWSIALPAPPEPGSALADWTGVFSSAQLSLDGERCPSPYVDPVTGLQGGTCNAGDR